MQLFRLSIPFLALLAATAGAQTLHDAGDQTVFGMPLADAALEERRGGSDTTVNNDMRLSGTTAGNTAHNVATGSNAVSEGAFSSMSGIPVVIQNTGANVLIQNAVILNLQIR